MIKGKIYFDIMNSDVNKCIYDTKIEICDDDICSLKIEIEGMEVLNMNCGKDYLVSLRDLINSALDDE